MKFFKGFGARLFAAGDSLAIGIHILVARVVVAMFPKPTSGKGLAYRSGYAALYYAYERVVIGWHRKELERLDPVYRRKQGEVLYGHALDSAEADGMSVSDPKYPQIDDFCPSTGGNWLEKLLPPPKRRS